MTDIIWYSNITKLKDIHDYKKNPKRIDKKRFAELVESIKQDGYHGRIKVDTFGTIIGGHQRKRALLVAGIKPNDTIEVLVPSRELTQEEFDRINIRDNLPYGEFDFDILANNFEPQQLIDWGMPEEWLPRDIVENLAIVNEPEEPKVKKCPACGEIL